MNNYNPNSYYSVGAPTYFTATTDQGTTSTVGEKTAVNARLHNRSGITLALAIAATAFTIAALVRFSMSFDQSNIAELVDELIGVRHLGMPEWVYPTICFIGLTGSGLLTAGLWWLFGSGFSRMEILTGSEEGPYNLIKAALIVKMVGFLVNFSAIPIILILGIIKAFIADGFVYELDGVHSLYALVPVLVCVIIIIAGSVFYKWLISFVSSVRDTHKGTVIPISASSHATRVIIASFLFVVCALGYPAMVLPNLSGRQHYSSDVGYAVSEVLDGTVEAILCSGLNIRMLKYNYYADNYGYHSIDIEDYISGDAIGILLSMIYNGDVNTDRYVSNNLESFFFSSSSGEAGRASGQAVAYFLLQFAAAVMGAVYILKLDGGQELLRQGGLKLPGREALGIIENAAVLPTGGYTYAQLPVQGAAGVYPAQQYQQIPGQVYYVPTQYQPQNQYQQAQYQQQYRQYLAQLQQAQQNEYYQNPPQQNN